MKPMFRLFSLGLLLILSACSTAQEVTTSTPTASDWITLYDGSDTEGWTQTGPGELALQEDGSILTEGGMGLFYFSDQVFRDFVLELEWMAESDAANSGIFVRFPDASDPWAAVNTGYEIQIHNNNPDPRHATGAIYSFKAPVKMNAKPAGEWNTYRIEVIGQRYQIHLNGEKVNDFFGDRGREGMIGVQNHDPSSKVYFRNIRVQPLPDSNAPESLAEHFAVEEEREPIKVLMVTATHGFRHEGAIEAARTIMGELETTTEFDFDFSEDLNDLNTDNLDQYDLLFFANSTLRGGDDVVEEEAETGPVAIVMNGDFQNWRVKITAPQGTFEGSLELSGEPDSLTGRIKFDQFPDASTLSEAEVTETEMKLKWDDSTIGSTVEVNASIEGELVIGDFIIGENTIPFEGQKWTEEMASASAAEAEAFNANAEQWEVTLETPQGNMPGVLTLSDGDDGLQGTLAFQGQGSAPLNDLVREGDEVTFNFDAGQYGTITGRTTVAGDSLSGSLNVQGGDLPLNGTRMAEETGEDEEEQPTVSEEQREAIMAFVRSGKGIVGAHSALDAFYRWNAYREMVGGGLFESHPWTESVDIVIEEPGNPAVAHLGDSFTLIDEIYVLDENPRWNSRVLASLDMSSVEATGDPAGNYRNDYPISWIREHEGGRVFITKLGHFADVWHNPDFIQHVLEGMRMAAGRLDVDFSGHLVKETVSEGVWPDDIAVDDEGDVWIAELTGKVFHYDAATGETTQIGEVNTTDPTKIEHGLYGIEVDPNFYDGEPWVYLYYAEPETIINTLSRVRFENGQLDMDSEEILLRVPTEPQCCHQAGDIEWKPDGTLLLSTGDTGMSETRPEWELTEEEIEAFKQENSLEDIQWSRLVDSERSAQNLQDLRGKIIRINKDGSIPKDNPFYGEPGVRWEVYAYGLRNPYRFKIDPETNYLYIGVVGPDAQFDYDEYNISTEGGENFGWPRDIGKLIYNEWSPDDIPNYRPPFWEYTYETGGRSASGGPVYRHEGPGAFPAIFQDRVFVYDWARGWIKWGKIVEEEVTLEKANGETYTVTTPRLTDIKTLDILRGTRPISMELGPDGAIYVAEFTGFWGPAPGSKVTRYRWVTNADEEPMGSE